MIKHGSQFNEESYEDWLRNAEDYCWQVINNTEVDKVSKRMSYHIVGRLIGMDTYTSLKGMKRPDFSEAISILRKAFESSVPDRNDDNKKSYQDIITHNALKDVYMKWYKSAEKPSPEERENIIKQADLQFERAFLGLPRSGLSSPEVIEHALNCQCAYGFFKWKWQNDPVSADFHYKEAIKKREKLNYLWPKAYTLYDYYAHFLFSERRQKDELPIIIDLLRKARDFVSVCNDQEQAAISHKLGHNLRSDIKNKLILLTSEEITKKMDETIDAFGFALKKAPEREDSATELSRFHVGPRGIIISSVCSKDRIDRHLRDVNSLRSLSELIENKDIADVLYSICNSRRNNKFRGMLTKFFLR